MSQQLVMEAIVAGSIRQRKDRGADTWELRIFLGRSEAGKIRHRSVLFRGSRRAAERELARLVADQDREPEPVPAETLRRWGPTTTINDAIEGWRANGWDDLSPSTTRRYLSMWQCHIKDSIGTRRIAQLGPYDVETYFRGLKEAGLAEASVRQIRAVLHRACRLARKWSNGSLSNPVAETELPEWTLGESSDEVRSPTADEIRRILAAAQKTDVRLSAFIRLVAATGFRRGETCALRWSDIDLNNSIVRVDSALVAVLGGTSHRGPKTRASVRAVAIDTGTLDVLRTLFDRQQALATACGAELGDDAYVFATEPGAVVPPHPDSMSHAFARIRGKAKVAADIHLHSLRHFQSTELDRVISEAQKQARLGWSTVQMARHYTDAVPAEDRKAAEHIGTLLDG
jgi:integrase